MASWEPPSTIAAGAPLPSAYFNTVVENEFFLFQSPAIQVFDGVGSFIPAGADTGVNIGGLTGTTFSTYGWSESTFGSIPTIVCPLAGTYQFSFRVCFNITGLSITTGGGLAQLFTTSGLGGQIWGSWVTFSSSAQQTALMSVGSTVLQCSAGEEIYLVAFQVNAGNTTVPTVSGAPQTGIDAVWLGSL